MNDGSHATAGPAACWQARDAQRAEGDAAPAAAVLAAHPEEALTPEGALVDDAQLQVYAETHLAYEVRTLSQQLDALRPRSSAAVLTGPVDLALMEAVLVHLRLLDAFVGGPRRHDDVIAEDYLPTWTPAGFLTSSEADAINAQVAHLAARRGRPKHRLWDMGRRCGERLGALEAHMLVPTNAHRERAAYLVEAFDWARRLCAPSRAMAVSSTSTVIHVGTNT